MLICRLLMLSALLIVDLANAETLPEKPAKPLTSAEIIAASKATDWRPIDPDNLLVMNLPKGKVLIELAPSFAPNHVANIKALAREHYYDGLAVLRVQDNYVAQWGDPDSKRPIKQAQRSLPAEFFRMLDDSLPFTPLGDSDVYAPEVGFSTGLPTVRDAAHGTAWLAHCYAMVGAGRDLSPGSGGGSELYAVIGHAPRHLDRNVTLVGRVVQGIDWLSSLPRGTGALGFYEKASQRIPLRRVRVAADLPVAQRPALEALRTDTATWTAYVDSRRNRRDDWFIEPTGHIEVCNVPLPIRPAKK